MQKLERHQIVSQSLALQIAWSIDIFKGEVDPLLSSSFPSWPHSLTLFPANMSHLTRHKESTVSPASTEEALTQLPWLPCLLIVAV